MAMLWLYVSAFHKCERERAQIHTFKTKQQRKKLVHLSLDITWHRLIYVANWNIWCVFHMNSPAEIKKPKTTSDETIDSSTKNIPFDLTHMLHFCVFGFFVSVPVLQCAYFNFSHWYVYTRLTHTFNWCVYDQRYCFFFQISFTGRISAVQCSFHRNHIFTAKRVYWTHDWLYVFI